MGIADPFIVRALVPLAVFYLTGEFIAEMRAARMALFRGNARRCRAFVRLFAGRRLRPSKRWLALVDATGLFWAGEFDEALARAEALSRSVPPSARGLPLALSIACQILTEHPADARQRFEESRAVLRRNRWLGFPVPSTDLLEGLLRFYEGNLGDSEAKLQRLIVKDPGSRNPFNQLARFHFAAIAHRRGDWQGAQDQLTELVRRGGNSFIVEWASSTHAELFGRPVRSFAPPRRPRRGEGAMAGLALGLRGGIDLMLLRGGLLRRAAFTPEQVVLLMCVDLGAILLGQCTEYSRGAEFSAPRAVVQLLPARRHRSRQASLAPRRGGHQVADSDGICMRVGGVRRPIANPVHPHRHGGRRRP